MADEAKTILQIDPTPALAALDQVRASVAGMEADYRRLNRTGDNLFDGAEKSTQDFIGDVDDLASTMSKAQAAMRNLVQYEKFLEAQQKRTTDPVLIKRYADEIARTRRAMKELRDQGVDTWQSVGREQQKGINLFGGLRGAVARALPIISLSAVAVGAVKAAGAYEQTRASFETFLKSAERADKLLGDLNAVSIRTPFTNEQFEQGAKSLLAVNTAAEQVVPTLEQIATISAATGKDFNELTTIYAKARTAGVLYAEDINQLIDAGIPIIEEFAGILDTTPDKVKKLASEGKISFSVLEGAFQNLTKEGGRFSGLLEKQSQTLPGLVSTLQGAFQNLLRVLGGGGLGESIKQIVSGLTGLTTFITNAFIPANEKASQAFSTQSEKVQGLEKNLVPLLERYDELRSKTAPTKDEQEELKTVIQQIGEITPTAITQIDKYGNAIAINADKSREFLEAERARLKFVNEEAIKETEKFVAATEKRVTEIQKLIETGSRFVAGAQGSTGRIVSLSAQEIQKLQREAAKLSESLKGASAELSRLRGEDIPDPETVQTGDPSGPTEEEIRKREEAARKFQEAERRRVQLRLDLLEDGRDKELEIERIRTQENLKELQKYFAGRAELHSVIEDEQEKHRRNVEQINKKYDDQEFNDLLDQLERQNEQEQRARQAFEQLERDRQDLRVELLEEGAQKEIAAEKKRFEALQAEIEKQFAGTAELTGLLETAREQHLANLNEINRAGLLEVIEGEKRLNDQELALIEAQGQKVILLLRQRGASEEEIAEAQRQFDLLTQKKRLEAEIKFQQALLAATTDGDEARRKEIQNQIDLLNQQLENLNIEINLPEPKGGKKFDLAGLLGLDDQQVQAVQQAANQIINSIGQITAARLAAAEEELQIAEDRVSEAEDALDREIELAEAGFASNVDLKRQELEEAKKQEAEALAERQKAQEAQARIDTIQQTISLITASANIFKALSAIPFVGIPLAIATIATMFAAFASVKANAARAAKFKQGGQGRVDKSGVVVGPSHDRGGVPLEVEGGEFFGTDGKRFAVVKKHLTGKHFDLLDAINRDATPEIVSIAAQMGAQDGIMFKSDTGARFEQRRTEAVTARQAAELEELRKSNALLRENNNYLKKMSEQKPSTTYFNGGREERLPGLTKIVRDGR